MSAAYFTEIFVIYLFFVAGYPPTTAMEVKVGLNVVMVMIRLYFAKREVSSFSIVNYFKQVLFPILLSTLLTVSIAFILYQDEKGVTLQIGSTVLISVMSIVFAYIVGLTHSERKLLKNLITKKIKRRC